MGFIRNKVRKERHHEFNADIWAGNSCGTKS